MRAIVVGAAAVLALVLGSAGAGAADGVMSATITGASVTATAVTVNGTGTFASPTQQVATDGSADNVIPGTDLRSASITAVNNSTLRFDLAVGDLPAPTGGTPEVVNYWWEFRVVRGTTVSEFGLQAWRSSAAADVTCGVVFACPAGEPGQPRFQLSTCTVDPTTGQRTCSASALTGAINAGVLSWTVPLTAISAGTGASIEPVLTTAGAVVPIAASHGVSGVSWATNGSASPLVVGGNQARAGDIMTWEAYTYQRSVTLGIAPAGTPVEEVATTTPATTISNNGNFSGSLTRPAAGDYVVVARACLGEDNCAVASRAVTVP